MHWISILLIATIAFVSSVTADVKWQTDIGQARKLAKEQGKPVLLLHLFGKLDEEFT